jgi:hypothetical protein
MYPFQYLAGPNPTIVLDPVLVLARFDKLEGALQTGSTEHARLEQALQTESTERARLEQALQTESTERERADQAEQTARATVHEELLVEMQYIDQSSMEIREWAFTQVCLQLVISMLVANIVHRMLCFCNRFACGRCLIMHRPNSQRPLACGPVYAIYRLW